MCDVWIVKQMRYRPTDRVCVRVCVFVCPFKPFGDVGRYQGKMYATRQDGRIYTPANLYRVYKPLQTTDLSSHKALQPIQLLINYQDKC